MKMAKVVRLIDSNQGLTLIELLVSMAVLSVLITGIVTIIDPLGQIRKAKDTQRKSDLSQIQKVVEQYYQDNGRYPKHATDVGNEYKMVNVGGSAVDWGTQWLPYINVLPKDPSSDRRYVYFADESNNGQAYWLYASLEREGNDPQACKPGPDCTSTGVTVGIKACGPAPGKYCNYGVSSPNVSVN